MYIRLRNGRIFYLNKKVRDRYNAWIEFCSRYIHKPRNEQFYKEFLEFMEIKETLIKNIIENGDMIDIVKLTSYVNSHKDEFKIENNIICLNVDKKSDIPIEKYRSLKEIVDILGSSVKSFYYIYVIKNRFGDIQYYVNIHEGKNGNGDFLFDDMTIVYSTMLKISKHASWISLTSMSADIPDDVSTWGVTFTL